MAFGSVTDGEAQIIEALKGLVDKTKKNTRCLGQNPDCHSANCNRSSVSCESTVIKHASDNQPLMLT